jgi:uncharacterized membrane protein YeaQ/YmgE (transglycosylase-associated protein family)
MEMLSFSSLCDAAIAKKRPILKGQATGCNLRRQAARTGMSPFIAAFLAYYCHLPAISMKLIGPDPSRAGDAAAVHLQSETYRKQFVLSSCVKLLFPLLASGIMGHLSADTLSFVIVLITICCFFLGHAMDNIMEDEGFGAYGNMALMWAGFVIGLYATSFLGYNMRDFRLASFGGLIGAFSLLAVCALSRSIFRRFVA